MAEKLHPGIYVEEKKTGLAPIEGVSTSNMGIVGFTIEGPTDEATLVTSYPNFEKIFGTFTQDSQVPTHVFAFFANGGKRAYVVRTVPSDAVLADGDIKSSWAEETIGTGDGSEKDWTATGTPLTDIAHVPIDVSSVSITYDEAGTAVTGQVLTCVPAPDGDGAGAGSVTDITSRIEVSGDKGIIPGTVTITAIMASPATEDYTDTAKDGILKDAGGDSRGYIDYKTGVFNLSFETAHIPDSGEDVTADYTPAGNTITITDDGAGNLQSDDTTLDSGTVDYDTGEVEFVINAASEAPHDQALIQIAYTQIVWDSDPISKGAWANRLRIDVRGDDDFFTRTTASYSRYDVLVYLQDADTLVFDLVETYEDLSMTDSTDARYIASVLNNEGLGSDYLSLTEPANEDVGPRSLSGYSKNHSVGAGNAIQTTFGSADGTGGTATIPAGIRCPNLDTPVQSGSVSIVYTDVSGTVRIITDDGDGNLIGDVDASAASTFNVIDYDTGDFAIQVESGEEPQAADSSHAATPTAYIGALSNLIATYYIEPVDTVVQDTFSGGSDGTSLTRSELTNPSLKTDREGMYALLTTNELINLTIPDAAGDVTMSGDMITEAETNELWFCILATPQGYTPQQAQNYRVYTLGANSSYAALYYPYITIADPVTDLPTNIPPGGHIAGVYARTDNNKTVGKAPAGVDDGKLNWSLGLEKTLEFTEVDILNPKQVNALMDTPQTGRCVWGARTLESPPSDFRYINARRLFNFLKASIFNSTHGFVFENVGEALWSRIRLSVESFLLVLYGQGMFKGDTPGEAFTVICDESNNPEEIQDAGQVICDIYVAVNKPGEFITFRLQQKVINSSL